MINTINISLPSQMKSEADKLVASGHYASFSDLARTAIRKLVESKYEMWIREAKADYKSGKTVALETPEEISAYLSKFSK